MLGARQGPPGHPVTVDVAIALEALHLVQLRFMEDLAPLEALLRVGERIGHPEVHPQVQVGEDEDRGLELLGQVEGLLEELVALEDRAGEQHRMAGVAVGEGVGKAHIALHGSGGQAGGWAHPLDVDEDRGDLSVVAEPDELRHQRDPRAGGGGHGPGAGPARPQHHSRRRQLVLRLDGRDPPFATLRVDAVAVGQTDQVLGQRGTGGDRIPGENGAAAHDRPQRRGLVAFQQELP